MSRKTGQEHRGWNEYREFLSGAGIGFVVVAVVAAVLSTLSYCWWSPQIEQISHRPLSPWWTCLLLLIPIVIQLLVFLRLRKKITLAIHDDELRAYFKFYFWRMALSLATYTVLWLLYVAVFGLGLGRIVQGVALVPPSFIVVLIGLIVHATHLITRTSFRDDELLLTEDEVTSGYDAVRHALKNDTNNEAETIRQWLRRDRDCKVHLLALKKEIRDLDITHLTEALNRLICSRGFYDVISDGNTTSSEELVPKDIEIVNRKYLNDHLLKSQTKVPPIDTKRDRRGRLEQKRLVKQKGQRDGIAMFPFYTMVFFFSIFLCIAYLFGFAFAFEDRSLRMVDAKHVALFMTDDQQEDSNLYAIPATLPSPRFYQLNPRQKVFYFNSGGAGITTEISAQSADQKLKHIARINQRSLSSLVGLISKKIPISTLRVLLIGRADDNSVDRVTYASNHEIAAARINSVRYLLQEKLIADHVSPNSLAAIQWVESPFSNDSTLAPKDKQAPEASKSGLVLNNEIGVGSNSKAAVPREFASNLDSEIWNSGSKNWKDELRDFLERLRSLSQKQISLQTMQKILDDIHRWDALKIKDQIEEAELLGDDIDAELYAIEDPLGRKRTVEVYLYDTTPPPPTFEALPSQAAHSKRMALMDYLYFAMYTITTTGYGDIKPMTAYGEFLCAFANMTEFFFIVVFFNTLLSLRRGKREMV